MRWDQARSLDNYSDGTPMMMMQWCLMSSDVSWHIRNKLWPMPKHGSMIAYVHGNQKARYDRQLRTATSTFTQLLNYAGTPICIGLKLLYLLKTRSVYVNILSERLPWYNRNGWLGIKHQVTYLLQVMVSSAILNLIWDENKTVSASEGGISVNFIFLVSLHIRQTEREQTTTKMLMYYCFEMGNKLCNK